jgi:sugar/nucleoside kinase (ribokinase family)
LLFELDYFHLCYFEPQGLLTLLEAVGEPLANILRETSSNGGGPYNVLIDQAPFSLEAVGLVGKDEAGEFIRADCRAHGIDTRQLHICENAPNRPVSKRVSTW